MPLRTPNRNVIFSDFFKKCQKLQFCVPPSYRDEQFCVPRVYSGFPKPLRITNSKKNFGLFD